MLLTEVDVTHYVTRIMASIHKQVGRPFWYCHFTAPDGTRKNRSTKTGDKRQALEICRAWGKSAQLGRAGKLTPETARDVIARTVSDVFASANREDMPNSTSRAWCASWLAA